MSAKPFRNSKGVNKPFRSPFSTPKNNATESSANTPESNVRETPLRVSVSKKLLFETLPAKRIRLSTENIESQADVERNNEFSRVDLESLKKRIEEKQESIGSLKTALLYKKKNKAEDLETAIKKWTNVCQVALVDYQNDLQRRNGQSMRMAEILTSFGIDPSIVCFSVDDDTFC